MTRLQRSILSLDNDTELEVRLEVMREEYGRNAVLELFDVGVAGFQLTDWTSSDHPILIKNQNLQSNKERWIGHLDSKLWQVIIPLHYVLILIRLMQSSDFFQICNFSYFLAIISEITITCLSWGGFRLLKLKKVPGRQRR